MEHNPIGSRRDEAIEPPDMAAVLEDLEWRRSKRPRIHLPHIAMLVDGEIKFGRYSEANHCFQAWVSGQYITVWPAYYADLGG